uniref:Uncharacterized protein n=1 Tax=Oryza brachyantha TaxID=4533 RepID=J3LHI4_ORYBR
MLYVSWKLSMETMGWDCPNAAQQLASNAMQVIKTRGRDLKIAVLLVTTMLRLLAASFPGVVLTGEPGMGERSHVWMVAKTTVERESFPYDAKHLSFDLYCNPSIHPCTHRLFEEWFLRLYVLAQTQVL